MTKTTKKFKEQLADIRNPKDGRIRYRIRKQQEEEDKKYLKEELKKLKEEDVN